MGGMVSPCPASPQWCRLSVATSYPEASPLGAVKKQDSWENPKEAGDTARTGVRKAGQAAPS